LDAGVNLNALSDKTVPFAVRLSELKKIQGDTALMTKLFGTENSAAANVLVSNTDLITDWQKQLVGTNTATEQAAIQMDTMSEKLSRMSAYWSNVGIEVFGYMKNILPALTFTTQAATLFSQLAPALSLVSSGFSTVSSAVFSVSKAMLASGISALKTAATYTIAALEGIGSWIAGLVAATAAQWELNIAMDANPIGLVILGLAAVAGAVYAIVANWDTVKQWMSDLGTWISDHNPFTYLYDGFMSVYQSLVGKFQALVEDVQWLWDGIKSIFQTPTDRLMAMAQADALKQHMAEKAGDGIWSNVGQRPAATAAPTAGVWESIGQTMGIKPEDKSLLQRIMSGDSGIQIKPEDKAWYEKFVNGQSRYNGSNATILAIQSGLLSKGGPKDLNGTGGGGAGTGQNAIDSTNQAIVNGGRKENNFYITLHDLVGTQNIHVTDGTHPKEVADATLEQLARVLTAVQRGN
jgi:hypothetical protein